MLKLQKHLGLLVSMTILIGACREIHPHDPSRASQWESLQDHKSDIVRESGSRNWQVGEDDYLIQVDEQRIQAILENLLGTVLHILSPEEYYYLRWGGRKTAQIAVNLASRFHKAGRLWALQHILLAHIGEPCIPVVREVLAERRSPPILRALKEVLICLKSRHVAEDLVGFLSDPELSLQAWEALVGQAAYQKAKNVRLDMQDWEAAREDVAKEMGKPDQSGACSKKVLDAWNDWIKRGETSEAPDLAFPMRITSPQECVAEYRAAREASHMWESKRRRPGIIAKLPAGVDAGYDLGVTVLAQPVIDRDGRMVLGYVNTLTSRALAVALNGDLTEKLWSASTSTGGWEGDGIHFAPILEEDNLALVSTRIGRVYKIDLRTGVLQRVSNGMASSGRLGRIGKRAFTTDHDGVLWNFCLESGAVAWRRELGFKSGGVVADGGRVYCANLAGDVFCIAAETGKLLWRVRTGQEIFGSVSLGEDAIITATWGGQVLSIEKDEGRIVWRHQLKGSVASAPVLFGGRVYVADVGGCVSAFEIATGKLVWKVNVKQPLVAPVCPGNGRLFVGGWRGDLFELDMSDGRILGMTKLADRITSSPVSVKGSLYVVVLSGQVFKLSTPHTIDWRGWH